MLRRAVQVPDVAEGASPSVMLTNVITRAERTATARASATDVEARAAPVQWQLQYCHSLHTLPSKLRATRPLAMLSRVDPALAIGAAEYLGAPRGAQQQPTERAPCVTGERQT